MRFKKITSKKRSEYYQRRILKNNIKLYLKLFYICQRKKLYRSKKLLKIKTNEPQQDNLPIISSNNQYSSSSSLTSIPILAISSSLSTSATKKSSEKVIKSNKVYFTKETEDAIVEYNLEKNDKKREEIYNLKIKYPFEKLVENVFNTFKFSYFETGSLDVQKETISHLVSNMHKFDASKGYKAFSYFSIIAKNYLIFLNNSNYKRFNQHVEIGEDREENTIQLQSEDPYYKNTEILEFIKLIINFWDENVKKIFPKEKDCSIASAVVELLRNSNRIDAFNKKALYLYIREISSCRAQNITKIINKMKTYHVQLKQKYLNDGVIA